MKPTVRILVAIIAIFLLLSLSSIAENEVKSEISGPELLRAGQEYTVVYSVSGLQCCGFQGILEYDSTAVTIVSTRALVPGWSIELLPNGYFILFSNDISDRTADFMGGDLFEIVFRVSDTFVTGSTFSFSVKNNYASDLEKDIAIPDALLEKKCDPPISSDAALKNLIISNVSLSPAFSPEILDYEIILGVEYEVSCLDITLETRNDRAKYEIIGNELNIGMNTVIIRVTAENGDVCDYSVKVKRNHSSDQPYSNDSRVSSITLSQGILSPAFSPDIYNYIVYLPYETKNIDISAEPLDAFARTVTAESGALEPGINEFIVKCVAEDTTSSEYRITVLVMSEYNGSVSDNSGKTLLEGSLKIELADNGENSYLTSDFSCLQSDPTYSIYWYRDGQLIADSESYTITADDEGHSIVALAVANGKYYGTCVSNVIAVDKKTENLLPTEEPEEDGNDGLGWLIGAIVASLFLSFGLLVGEIKGKRIANSEFSELLSKFDDNDASLTDKPFSEIDDETEKSETEQDGGSIRNEHNDIPSYENVEINNVNDRNEISTSYEKTEIEYSDVPPDNDFGSTVIDDETKD